MFNWIVNVETGEGNHNMTWKRMGMKENKGERKRGEIEQPDQRKKAKKNKATGERI